MPFIHFFNVVTMKNTIFFMWVNQSHDGSMVLVYICSHLRGILMGSMLPYTLWLFNIAMENGPFIDGFPIKTSIYKGFSMAMLNNFQVQILQHQLVSVPLVPSRYHVCPISLIPLRASTASASRVCLGATTMWTASMGSLAARFYPGGENTTRWTRWTQLTRLPSGKLT